MATSVQLLVEDREPEDRSEPVACSVQEDEEPHLVYDREDDYQGHHVRERQGVEGHHLAEPASDGLPFYLLARSDALRRLHPAVKGGHEHYQDASQPSRDAEGDVRLGRKEIEPGASSRPPYADPGADEQQGVVHGMVDQIHERPAGRPHPLEPGYPAVGIVQGVAEQPSEAGHDVEDPVILKKEEGGGQHHQAPGPGYLVGRGPGLHQHPGHLVA